MDKAPPSTISQRVELMVVPYVWFPRGRALRKAPLLPRPGTMRGICQNDGFMATGKRSAPGTVLTVPWNARTLGLAGIYDALVPASGQSGSAPIRFTRSPGPV